MKTFRTDDREWAVKINVETIRRVRDRLGVLLTDVLEDKMALLAKLAGADPILLCDVLYVVCEDEAKERKVSSEDFGRSLAGDSITRASEALLAELTDFFHDPRTRKILATLREKMEKIGRAMMDKAEAMVAEIDPAEAVLEASKRIGSVGSSPAA